MKSKNSDRAIQTQPSMSVMAQMEKGSDHSLRALPYGLSDCLALNDLDVRIELQIKVVLGNLRVPFHAA